MRLTGSCEIRREDFYSFRKWYPCFHNRVPPLISAASQLRDRRTKAKPQSHLFTTVKKGSTLI